MNHYPIPLKPPPPTLNIISSTRSLIILSFSGETSSLCHSDCSSKENHGVGGDQPHVSREIVLKSTCPKCGNSFNTRGSLIRHLKQNHEMDREEAIEAAKKAKRKKFVVKYDKTGKAISVSLS